MIDVLQLRFDRKEPADSAMLADSARRLLTWTMDWTRLVANLEEALDTDDKVWSQNLYTYVLCLDTSNQYERYVRIFLDETAA